MERRVLAAGSRVVASLSGPLAFAFLGGYADASGYVLAGTFTGHVTGAMVLAAFGAAAGQWHTFILRLCGIASFLAGVAIAESLAEQVRKTWSQYLLTLVIAVELLLFALAYLSARFHAPREVLVICLSLALGLQNGAWHRLGSAATAHTTFLTGLSINLAAAETDRALHHSHAVSGASSLKMPASVWLTFFLGAAFGAGATLHFHALAILGAVALLVTMTASAARRAAHSSVCEGHDNRDGHNQR